MSTESRRDAGEASAGERLVQGSGVMAAQIRGKDWGTTPLGSIGSWSETLVATVNLLLLSPLSFALYWGEARTLLYNDTYRPFLGEKHPDALGRSGREIWPEAWPVIGPPIESAFTDGTVTNSKDVPIPVLIGGGLQERYWTYCFYPVYERGRIVGVANIGYDSTSAVLVTQQMQENEVRSSRTAERLGQVMEATTDAIVSLDRNWVMTYLNPKAEAMYGTATAGGRLLGRRVWDEFPGAVYEGSPYVEHFTRAMEEGVAGSFEAHYPEPLNAWLRVEAYPTRDGIVTVSRDISEEKRVAALLIQTEKLTAVGRLASSIAHEINNPLEAVTNLLYLVRSSEDVNEIHEYAELADRELRRMALITSQTLRFHKQSTKPTAIYCHDLIGESLVVYQGRLLNSHIAVEKRKQAEQPVSCFDGEIRQVLSNLIGNAIDAMPHGGRLLLRSREARDWKSGERGLVLTVADTGTGMSAEVQKKMFTPFFTTKGIGGTGLGLWVSHEIMGRHQGWLRVRSAEGRGTVFMLFLPFIAVAR